METRPIFLLVAVLVAGVAFADAYTWTDENGVVHFSDRPQPGAKQIELPDQQRSRRPTPTTRAASSDDGVDDSAGAPFEYRTLEISTPGAEETLWNIEGVLSVSLSLAPTLQPGHQVRVYFDGTPQIVNGTTFQLQEVWRGVHNLQVEVVDETGQLMIRSRPSRFYVQQATVL